MLTDIFNNNRILTNVTSAEKPIVMNGVQKGAPGVKVIEQGDFLDIGSVYWSSESAANLLSKSKPEQMYPTTN